MSVSVPFGHPSAEQIYSIGATIEAERAVRLMALAGRSDSHAIIIGDDFANKRGSNVKKNFRPRRHGMVAQPRGTTVVGNTPTRPNATDDLSIRYQILATGEIENLPADQQHVSMDLKDLEQRSMTAECSEMFEAQMMNQLSGYTVVNDLSLYPEYAGSGGNICREPDTAHWMFAPDNAGANANEAAVAADASSQLTNRMVDAAIARSRSLAYVRFPLVPAATPWGDLFPVICHGEGMLQVKENNTDGEVYELTKAEIQGGLDIDDTWLATGEGFILGKALYLESDYCTLGTTGTQNSTSTSSSQANVRRAILLGARAMHLDYGEAWINGVHIGYSEHEVLRTLTMMMDTCWGCKAVTVESSTGAADWQRWGSFVLSHYSPV